VPGLLGHHAVVAAAHAECLLEGRILMIETRGGTYGEPARQSALNLHPRRGCEAARGAVPSRRPPAAIASPPRAAIWLGPCPGVRPGHPEVFVRRPAGRHPPVEYPEVLLFGRLLHVTARVHREPARPDPREVAAITTVGAAAPAQFVAVRATILELVLQGEDPLVQDPR